MNKGFVKLPRSLKDHPLLNQKRRYSRFEAYLDLLDRASFHVSTVYIKKQEITLVPGQLLCSLATLAKVWGWHRTTVRDFLNELRTAGLADTLTEKGLTRITVTPEAGNSKEDSFFGEQSGTATVSGAYSLSSEATSLPPPRSKKKEGKKEEFNLFEKSWKKEFLERDSVPVDPEFAAFVREAMSGPHMPKVDGTLMIRLRNEYERRRAG